MTYLSLLCTISDSLHSPTSHRCKILSISSRDFDRGHPVGIHQRSPLVFDSTCCVSCYFHRVHMQHQTQAPVLYFRQCHWGGNMLPSPAKRRGVITIFFSWELKVAHIECRMWALMAAKTSFSTLSFEATRKAALQTHPFRFPFWMVRRPASAGVRRFGLLGLPVAQLEEAKR